VTALLSLGLLLSSPAAANGYAAGAARHDITGPVADHAMMGFGKAEIKNAGLHTRLYARAFVLQQGEKTVAFVSADLGMISPFIRQEVIARLGAQLPEVFSYDNVLISATHTHAGPGGYFKDRLYRISAAGFSRENTEVIVGGIVAAIVDAHHRQQRATVALTAGSLRDASVNQSGVPYRLNPDLAPSDEDRNTLMTQLSFFEAEAAAAAARPIGALNWFSVHTTTMGSENLLVSGDNKGVASALLERHMEGDPDLPFVAAFANSDEGDISSDVFAPDDTSSALERTHLIGQRQHDRALALLEEADAEAELSGPLDYRHAWVEMPQLTVRDRYTGQGDQQLCRAALGYSFAAGSEDGPSELPGFEEGMLRGERTALPALFKVGLVALRPLLRGRRRNTRCHGPKPILVTTGATHLRWTPEALPFQLIRVGPLVIAGVPGEMTTEAGRRLRAQLLQRLDPLGVERIVIAGLSNAYSHYVTTYEEYQAQHYEGASTLYGPHTFAAYLQAFDGLAEAMVGDSAAPSAPSPSRQSWRGADRNPAPSRDDTPSGQTFGQALSDPSDATCGDTVTATFRAAHPKNGPAPSTFLRVQRRAGDGAWLDVATDAAPETRFRWAAAPEDCRRCSVATVEWDSPTTATPGTYRLAQLGIAAERGQRVPYEGWTSDFELSCR